MFKVKPIYSSQKLTASMQDCFMVATSYLSRDVNLKQFQNILNLFFVFLAGDCCNRIYLPGGFRDFCIGFHEFNFEFQSLTNDDDREKFYDKFYLFLDDCFPLPLDEEVDVC